MYILNSFQLRTWMWILKRWSLKQIFHVNLCFYTPSYLQQKCIKWIFQPVNYKAVGVKNAEWRGWFLFASKFSSVC